MNHVHACSWGERWCDGCTPQADRHQEWVNCSSGVNSGEDHTTCPCPVLPMYRYYITKYASQKGLLFCGSDAVDIDGPQPLQDTLMRVAALSPFDAAVNGPRTSRRVLARQWLGAACVMPWYLCR